MKRKKGKEKKKKEFFVGFLNKGFLYAYFCIGEGGVFNQ